ncbi:MAG: S8 family serine peptidase [Bacteroidetes bacterium]|nr:S8 family serine peptidase [Bacteroidota bacterium]
MLITGLLTIAAFLLIASAASRPGKSPILMLAGMALLSVSIAGHMISYTSIFPAVTALSAEIGVGLLLVAGFLARKKIPAKPFFFLGSASLAVCVFLLGIGHFLDSGGDNSLARNADLTTLLVELGPDDSIDEISSTLAKFNADYERAFPRVTLRMDENLAQVYLVTIRTTHADRLREELLRDVENIDHVGLNWTVGLEEPIVSQEGPEITRAVLENDPFVSLQWGMEAIRGHEAHALIKDLTPERKARVAILDTGVDAKHEDIRSAFSSSPAASDVHGHGSHCAGIAGAVTNNGLGIASLNWEGEFIEVTAYQALNDQGFGTIEMIAQAIIDATRDEVDVISMSLGGKSEEAPKTIVDAIKFAQRHNVIVVVSAGNSNEDAVGHMPSNVDGVIVVSAVDENLQKASFSNTNGSLAMPITAPGVNILSLKTEGGYVQMSGTSMSTPMVSGLVGVMRAFSPDLTADEVYAILHSTGRNLGESSTIGRLINAEEAIKAVR